MLLGQVGRADLGIAVILANASHKTHAPARQGFYQPLLVAGISDYTPRRVDAVGQGGLGNDAPVPDRGQQIFLGDDPFAVSHQMNEEIENLGLDSHKRTFPAQFPPIRVEYAVLEMIAQDKIPLVAPRKCNTRSPKKKWREP